MIILATVGAPPLLKSTTRNNRAWFDWYKDECDPRSGPNTATHLRRENRGSAENSIYALPELFLPQPSVGDLSGSYRRIPSTPRMRIKTGWPTGVEVFESAVRKKNSEFYTRKFDFST